MKPGLFSPSYEKRFYEGLQAYLSRDFATAFRAFEVASGSDSRNVSDELFAGITANHVGDKAKAITYMERVVESPTELPDQLMQKYLANASVMLQVSLTPLATVQVEASSVGAALMLAELYQEAGRREDAIGLIQQLYEEQPQNLSLRLSLCDLLFEDDDYEGVVEVASGIENENDEALGCLLLKSQALIRMNMTSAAIGVLTECLKRSKRDPALLKEARYARAEAYQSTGKSAMARRDWEKQFADDPKYKDVGERLRG